MTLIQSLEQSISVWFKSFRFPLNIIREPYYIKTIAQCRTSKRVLCIIIYLLENEYDSPAYYKVKNVNGVVVELHSSRKMNIFDTIAFNLVCLRLRYLIFKS